MALSVLILAAGKGTRMKSTMPKVVHPILRKPMINYVLDSVSELKPAKTCVVVGYKQDLIKKAVSDNNLKVEFIVQEQQLGTGHAVSISRAILEKQKGSILILNGDCPGITASTLKRFVKKHSATKSALSLITSTVEDPRGYGRVVTDSNKNIKKIIEEKDATPDEKKIDEINSGIYCVKADFLWNALQKLNSGNKQNEYYLPDIIENAVNNGRKVSVLRLNSADEILGVNNRQELAGLEYRIKHSVIQKLQRKGVTVVDPETTFISPDVNIGRDTVINPSTYIYGKSIIGAECMIGPNVYVENSVIKNSVKINFSSYLNSCEIGDNVTVGPFAHLRPEANIGKNAKIGNFVEIKKSDIGTGSKVPHLSYIGDASLGKDVNIGAGSITCNYDGVNKHRTTIGDNVFIGSDSMLVAPVEIQKGSTTAAGSTITKDVEEYSLAIERSQQKIIKGWNKRKKKS